MKTAKPLFILGKSIREIVAETDPKDIQRLWKAVSDFTEEPLIKSAARKRKN